MANESTILTLVGQLALSLHDATVVGEYYERTLAQFAKRGFNDYAYAQATTSGVDANAYPPGTVRVRQMFFDDLPLLPVTNAELEGQSENWHSTAVSAEPMVVLLRKSQAVVYPPPNASSGAVSATFTTAFGSIFVADSFSFLVDSTETTVVDWSEGVLAFLLIAQEFSRESDHQDGEYASLADQFAELFFALLSHNRPEPAWD